MELVRDRVDPRPVAQVLAGLDDRVVGRGAAVSDGVWVRVEERVRERVWERVAT